MAVRFLLALARDMNGSERLKIFYGCFLCSFYPSWFFHYSSPLLCSLAVEAKEACAALGCF